ncbi:AbrB/MazE/SpoVT family DNA-binding domain-containing protein [Caenimonas koreensis DSM 17982]|uniref:AbrB/MazE/SpoVT family DNA-binding domain-containing protein n=1 Tax=Caenimonas koreensis DSM 17982 TaxID=1121255 RepID=A0A844ARK0_9BURK|nr:AbrB/MazE/SpoVT family DNA-binding domain-containing protein [Caenimonas koreensis]MRD46875.1 AbrB/MazE/SpoVT family DNA-binding domain-containing protein [Caenimonas koreensis DSM 17982]
MRTKVKFTNETTPTKAALQAVDAGERFQVEGQLGQTNLATLQRGDAVRTKLVVLALGDADVVQAVKWSRSMTFTPHP